MENEVVYLYLDDIIPNRFQPRENFNEQAMKELAVSIKEHGVIQPIVVRKLGEKYEIIAGERRYKASTMAGLAKIPAIIRNLDDKESSKVALIENLQRKDLTPIEEARTYQKILELDALTQEELAKTMGKSQSAVANKLRLLSLTDEVQDAILKEQISERHARSLLNVSDAKTQVELLNKIISQKMTVRELEEEIKKTKVDNNLVDIKPIESAPNININKDISPITANDTNDYSSQQDVIGGGLIAGLAADKDTQLRTQEVISSTISPKIDVEKPIVEISQNKEVNNSHIDIEPKNILPNVNNSVETLDLYEPEKSVQPVITPIVPNPIETLTHEDTNKSVSSDINKTISNIKGDVDRIKNSYKEVDIDEFDFDDFYQIIIRIDKNQ